MMLRAELVGWVTGERSPDRTDQRWSVGGTDLGIMWPDGEGGVLAAFGDTFHPRQPEGGGGGGDWRSNVIARSTSRDLNSGVRWDWFAEDRPGHAREVLPSRKVDRWEKTVIPTGGCCVGGRQFLAYMSVRQWLGPGRWRTGHAGLAWSDDGGRTWLKPRHRWWRPGSGPSWLNTRVGDQRWQLCTLVPHDGWVYVFGTPQGRDGAAYLARTPEGMLLDVSSWHRWDGEYWMLDEWRAVPVIPAPVSELSVMWHAHSSRWVAAYYRESVGAIVVHTAPELTGPWTEPVPIAHSRDWPGLYGAFLHPWCADSPDLFFLMSQWGPYNVALMRVPGFTERVDDD